MRTLILSLVLIGQVSAHAITYSRDIVDGDNDFIQFPIVVQNCIEFEMMVDADIDYYDAIVKCEEN